MSDPIGRIAKGQATSTASAVLADAPLLVCAFDRDGVVVSVEGGGLARIGIDATQAIGVSIFEIHKDDPQICADSRRAIRGESFTTLARFRGRIFEIHYAPRFDGDGRRDGSLTISFDVTDREEAVEALVASEQRHRAFTEHANDAIVEIDGDGTILYASPRFSEITGYDLDVLIGVRSLDFVHPDDVTFVDELRDHAMRSRTPAEMIFRIRHFDGSWHWLELSGRPYETSRGELRAVLIMRDVSARIRAQHDSLSQLELERRLGELSRQLLMLESERLADGVDQGLAAAAAMVGSDRCYLANVGRNGDVIAYEWARDDVPQRDFEVGESLARQYGETFRQLTAGRVVEIPRVADLPEEAAAVREGLEALAARSALLIPVLAGSKLIGIFGFQWVHSERTCKDHEINVLRLAAELFTGALRRKRAEVALHASEDRFRVLAENADDAIAEIDATGRFLYVNPTFQRMLGYSLEELSALPAFETIHPDDRAGMLERHGFSAESPGTSGTAVFRAIHRDGSVRWIEASGRGFKDATGVFRMVAVLRDVTEREKNQRALERQLGLEKQVAVLSRRFLVLDPHEVDDGIREGVATVGALAGADRCWLVPLMPVADGASSSYGWDRLGLESADAAELPIDRLPWSQAELSREKLLHIRSVENLPEEAAVERRFLESRGVQSFLGIPLLSDHGSLGFLAFESRESESGPDWDEETIRPLRLAGEIFVGALSRKRAEEALANSQIQLVQAQKMEAVGTLAGGIAHDFNNQLAVILGNARHVLRNAGSDGDLRDALVDLERAAEHCAQLTRALLAFSRQTPVESRSVEIRQALVDLAELLAPLIPSSIHFEIDAADELAPVVADPTQLQQVLVNLAINARDAMPDGGRLSIRAAMRPIDTRAVEALGLPEPGDYVEVSVVDTGVGIDERTRERIFDPFFTTKPPGKGTGLGLATAYGIVRETGGAIEVSSEVGRGTTFRVLLPGAPCSEEDSELDEALDVHTGSETVLVVEDEPRVRRLLVRMLERNGYRVLQACDGNDGLRISAEYEDEIDLTVTDLIMPGLGGADLGDRLLAHRPGMGLLFVSGYSEGHAGITSAEIVAKPFEEVELLAAVRRALEGDRPA